METIKKTPTITANYNEKVFEFVEVLNIIKSSGNIDIINNRLNKRKFETLLIKKEIFQNLLTAYKIVIKESDTNENLIIITS